MAKVKLFYWKGINNLQQKQQGSLIAESKQDAYYNLLRQGLQKIKLQQNITLSTKPKNAEVCSLLNQLAMLLNATIPLKSALQILQKNCTNIDLYLWLDGLINKLESGVSFSKSLLQQRQFLNSQEIQLIKVGEMTGKLAIVSQKIAEQRNRSLQLQRKLQKIMLYPSVVLAISITLSLLLLIFIMPQFAEMYENNSAQLPTFTTILLQLSESLQRYFIPLLIGVILLILLFRYQLRHSDKFHRKKEQFIRIIPILGKISQLASLINFSQNLSLMLQTGVPLNQALGSFLTQTQSWEHKKIQQTNTLLEEEVRSILHWISQGYHFSRSVSCQLFPTEAQQMLQIGEKTGKLATMLQYIADSYQEKLNHQIDLLSQMLEPILMLIIGMLIGIIMLGMYLPIFNMGSVLQ
ncbi:type II secretion system F family protein [Rodentibacter caecimuris]|uniref:Type II secretion system protein F n=1 Tax=Rodentibacter caecimuris TaxID=1796644 RepID=A0ABX3KZY2_9PAST|nr:type II secretion system protein F [Rodentibacter heylii]